MHFRDFIFYSLLITGAANARVIDLRSKTSCAKLVRVFNNHRSNFPLYVDIEKGFPKASFLAYREQWDEAFNFEKWQKILARLERKDELKDSQFKRIQDLKKIGSRLRHHFELFTTGHEIPEDFQELIKKFGQLRDRILADKSKKARKAARKIEDLLEDYNPADDLESFKSASATNIQRYIKEQNAIHANMMKVKGMTVYDFHHVKKYIRSLKMLLIMQTEIYQDEGLEDSLKLIKKVYKKMDKIIDKMTMKKVQEGMLYRDTEILLDPAFVNLVKNILI